MTAVSGGDQVIVRPFPDVENGMWPVSTDSGNSPRWSADGSELFYIIGNNIAETVMRVKVETEPTFKHGDPEVLFHGTYLGLFPDNGIPYDVHPDGKRFLMMKGPGGDIRRSITESSRKINIVLNWFEELKDRVLAD